MTSLSLPSADDTKILSALEDCMKACNKNLYTWNQPSRTNRYKLIDNHEIRGLFVNWFTRHLKSIIGYTTVCALMRNGKPIVEIDKVNNYITKVTFAPSHSWSSNLTAEITERLIRLSKLINYEKCKYDPLAEVDYGTVTEMNRLNDVSSLAQINFSSIESITFKI
jgi:hypothetical protein